MCWLQTTHFESVKYFLANVLGISTNKVHQKISQIPNAFIIKYFDPFSSLKGVLIASRNPEKPKKLELCLVAFQKTPTVIQTEKILSGIINFCQSQGIETVDINMKSNIFSLSPIAE